MSINRFRAHTSKDLEKRLQQLIDNKDRVEEEYRNTHQKFWTICFIDITDSANKIYELGENIVNAVFANYQCMIHELLQKFNVCFIEPSGGPQIVCCFENPVDAVDAMGAVINLLVEWNQEQDEILQYMPAIGVHIGYINYHDGVVHQSNTSNMAKRIQTKAKPGEILISSDVQNVLKTNHRFKIDFQGIAELKNIPEPQDIYKVKSIKKNSRQNGPASTSNQEAKPVQRLRESHQWLFVYIDVCGSTKKFWSYGDREASELIQRYQKLCHAVFELYNPNYVKSCEGDQIVACFDKQNANNAMIAAIQIMKLLFRRNVKMTLNKQVHAAVGIHVGEVILENNHLVTTPDMRIGKEIQSEATADEILISQEALRLCGRDADHALEDCGYFDFDGLPHQYHLKRLLWHKVQTKAIMLKF